MAQTKIYIIGAGAVGKALAVFLTLDHKEVTLIRGSVNDRSAVTEEIQVVMENDTLTASIEISTLSNFSELDGIIVLTNKSYGNEHLAQELKEKVHHSPIVILQNGLDIEEPFVNHNFPEIYRCVLFLTSQLASSNKVSYKPVAVSPVGVVKGTEASLHTIVEQLNSSHLQFRAETEIQPIIWKKAVINSVFNSICPLLDVDNGIFHRDAEVLKIAKRVVGECIVVSNGVGVPLSTDEVLEGVLLVSRSSDGQFISTLQDIRNKRETEIETLNLKIADIAKALNKEAAVAETRLLGELTKLKSNLSR